jgi:hypothetical protein
VKELTMLRALPLCAGAIVLALTGILPGIRTDRWGVSPDLRKAGERLEAVPEPAGDWEGQPFEISDRELKIGGVTGYLARRYVNRITSEEAMVIVVCGRPGAIAVHTPDICYQGLGYQMANRPNRVAIPGGKKNGDLWTATFTRTGGQPDSLRIFWGWTADGPWQAADNPRFRFLRAGALYKLYVVRRLPWSAKKLETEDPSLKLLEALQPQLAKCLSAAS